MQLLLQAVPALTDPFNLGALSNLTATGLMLWVVWYLIGRGIPKMQEAHDKQDEMARTAFLAELKTSRDQFAEQLTAQRKQCNEEQAARDSLWEKVMLRTTGKIIQPGESGIHQ